jgi:hypothetical protein
MTWWPDLLVFSPTLNNMSVLMLNMEANFFYAYRHFQQDVSFNV